MAPLNESPTPGNKESRDDDGHQKSTIARFATLLGAFRLKKFPQNTKSNDDDCLSTLFTKTATCSVPSLSLTSYHHHHHQNQQDKHQVEEHAASNLARPLEATIQKLSSTDTGHSTNSTADLQSVTGSNTVMAQENEPENSSECFIHQLPLQMLDNIAASFLTLVDARLRAYITILARHGVSLSDCPALDQEERREGVLAVERKLDTLVEVGSGVSIDNMVAFFRLKEESNSDDVRRVPIIMETTLDVAIPEVGGGSQLVTIAASAEGTIEASFTPDDTMMLTHVNVTVDTHQLLAQLVDRASLVMSAALDIVVAVSALPPHVPPAPLPNHKPLCASMKAPKPVAAQVSLAVVSPEITAKRRQEDVVSPLELDGTSELSPESCANIVDFVIGEVDHIIFPPLTKRLKTTHS